MLIRASKSCARRSRLWLELALGLAAATLMAAPRAAFGQEPSADVAADPQAKDAAEQRASSFQAVEGAVKEDIPGGPLLVAGYGVLWVALLLYLIRLARQQQVLQRDLSRLERALGKTELAK